MSEGGLDLKLLREEIMKEVEDPVLSAEVDQLPAKPSKKDAEEISDWFGACKFSGL